MKVIDCTTQQAGECADALRKLVADPSAILDMDGDPAISVRDQFILSDLLVALEDAERGVEGSGDSPVTTHDLGGEGG